MVSLAKHRYGPFTLKHVNWLIKLLGKSNRPHTGFDSLSPSRIPLIHHTFRKLIELKYPARRIRLLFDRIKYDAYQTKEILAILQTIINAYRDISYNLARPNRLVPLEKEITYYRSFLQKIKNRK